MIIKHSSPNKSERINKARDALLEKGVIWEGRRFETDSRSQQLIASRALKIVKRRLLEEDIEPVTWITADNDEYIFQVDEFLEFAEAVDAHVEALIMEAHVAKHY